MIKRAWSTVNGAIFTLSLESKDPEIEHNRITTREILFPNNYSKENPLRHTVMIPCLDIDDINTIIECLEQCKEEFYG